MAQKQHLDSRLFYYYIINLHSRYVFSKYFFGAEGPNQNTCVCGLVLRVPTKTRLEVFLWC